MPRRFCGVREPGLFRLHAIIRFEGVGCDRAYYYGQVMVSQDQLLPETCRCAKAQSRSDRTVGSAYAAEFAGLRVE